MNFPIPPKRPKKLMAHDTTRTDEYFWMRERENPEVIQHLKAENTYTESVMKPYTKLQNALYEEMKARVKEDDASAPYFKNGYWYYTRYEKGKEHAVYCRKKGTRDAAEEILIDENLEAERHPYYEIVAFAVTFNNKLLAFAEDRSGRRQYHIRFKNLESGEMLPQVIENAGSDLTWHNDHKTLYFSKKHPESLRPYAVDTFDIESGNQKNVYEDPDEAYVVGVNKSDDYRYIFIGSYSTLTTEFRFKRADNTDDFEIFLPRKEKHEYYPEPAGDYFILKTNHEAKNFRLVSCPVEERTSENWHEIQPHVNDTLIEDFEVFNTHIIVQEKRNGLSGLRVYDKKTFSSQLIPPSEETYTLYLDSTPDSTSTSFRIGYSSMTTPHSIIDIDFNTFERTVVKQIAVLGTFSPDDYKSERIWAKSEDGTAIPASLVYKKTAFNPHYASENLLRLKTASKSDAMLHFLISP